MKKNALRRNWTCKLNGETQNVTIPNDFMVGTARRADSTTADDGGYFIPGRAEYRTIFHADPSAAHHFLRFDGVMGLTEVYVNHNLVKFHPYGYTSFICCADEVIREGENELWVSADTTAQISSRWYTGGIIRDVELLTAEEDYICPNSIFVRTKNLYHDKASVQIDWKVYSNTAQTAAVKIAVAEPGVTLTRYIRLEKGENAYSVRTMLHDITPWTPDTPQLYTCTVSLETEHAKDEDAVTFGIRTVECDPNEGLLLNGKPIKLYGTCVHHDNGIIGAASYRSAEERRVRILKENGFNAIRCAHNPPSAVMLDACDRLGMLVIDEIFDAWRIGKRNYDYHIWFDRYWAEDTDSMVLRDRNHPSVIMWSTGNEIPEKNGISGGFATSKMIADRIRMHDDTRPLTHAFCSFWDNPEYSRKENETLNTPADSFDFYADRIRYTAGTLDVYGYNYLLWRMEKDEVRFPDMLFVMTESFPMDAVQVKKYMDKHPRMIGEFVWTGWDYFGETGIGHVKYGEDVTGTGGLTRFPNHIADCGDFDICGNRKAPSYYRETAWDDGCIRILTADPEKTGKKYAISAWGFYDVGRTWTYPVKDGMMTAVHVYTMAEECELWQDGVSLGRKTPSEKGIAIYEVPYKPGTLTAVSYRNGEIAGRDELSTIGTAESIRVTARDIDDLIYAEIELLDADNNIAWNACHDVAVTAENAVVVGTGSGKIDTDHIYTATNCAAYHGRVLAAILPDEGAENVKITATAADMTASITVKLRETI